MLRDFVSKMVPWTLTNITDASMTAHPAQRITSPTTYSSTLNNNLTSWLALNDQNSRPALRPILIYKTTTANQVSKYAVDKKDKASRHLFYMPTINQALNDT